MFKPFKVSFLLMALLASLATMAPLSAHADDGAQPKCGTGGDFKNAMQQNFATAAQNRSAAAHNVLTGIPAIDVHLNYCMDLIKAMFDLNVAMSNPLLIIQNIVRDQILNLVNQACQAAISVATQVIQFGLSQLNRFCIPIPTLALGGINLGLKGPTCNGVNLLNPQVTQGPTPVAPNGANIWTLRYNQ